MRKREKSADGRIRFSFWELLAFSSGGVIGSGWLLGPAGVTRDAHGWGWLSWLIGGVAVLIIGLVMMELGRAWGQDGGLIWWPLKSSGPVVAMVVVAASWIFYAANPASEAEAVVEFSGHWLPSLVSSKNHSLFDNDLTITWAGAAFGAVLVLLLAGINALGLRLVARITVVATALKAIVPVVVLALLIYSSIGNHAHPVPTTSSSPGGVLRAITSGGVIYAYTGFQATVDFGGRVRERDRDRLPWTVIVPVLFGLVFFTLLQWLSAKAGLRWQSVDYDSPYVQLAAGVAAVHMSFAWLIRLDEFVSPLGCGLVYTAALGHTTENASLHGLIPDIFSSRANLPIPGRRRSVAWFTLAVNAVFSLVILACLRPWATLAEASGIITLFVYAIPSVSHAALLRHTTEHRQADPVQKIAERLRRAGTPRWLAPLSFWLMTLILYWANWEILLPAIGLITGAAALLIVLRPRRWRRDRAWPGDDQRLTWHQWRDSLGPAWWLAGYGCGLAALSFACSRHHSGALPWLGMAAALTLAVLTFRGLVASSAGYMAVHSPADLDQRSVVRLYLSSGHEHQALEDALAAVLDAFSFEIIQQFPAERGSWFREFLIQASDGTEAITALNRALGLLASGQPQASGDGDLRTGEAIARLAEALREEEKAAIQIDSDLLVKANGSIVYRKLARPELAVLDNNPGLWEANAVT